MMKFLITIVCYLAVSLQPLLASAQSSGFDDIPLNGVAAFTQLRKEYYIGALYLESLSKEAETIFTISGKKRMDLKISIDKWPRRRFARQWNQAILINNSQESLEEFADEILRFTDLPKDDLIAGDRITIDMDPEVGTRIYINGNEGLTVNNNAFFDLLLNVWIGQRPPSSDFKNDILVLDTGLEGTNLLTRFQATIPSNDRKKAVANWFQNKKKTIAKKTNNETASAAVPPPSSDTTVTAKRKIEPDKVDIAIGLPKPAQTASAPEIEIEKPTLTTPVAAPSLQKPAVENQDAISSAKTSTANPSNTIKEEIDTTPEATPETPAESSTAKEVVVVDVDSGLSDEEKEQQGLVKAYKSNLLKLTFLNTQYPKRAMALKQEGMVIMRIKVNHKGKLLDVTTVESSGKRLLDKAAASAIKQAAPYPEAPKDIKQKEFEVTLPFNFKL